MTNLGVARIRLEADDSRLIATLSQLPGKVAAVLGLIETRSKAQMGRSGSIAGNTFAQSMAVAAQAAVKSVETVSAQAGKAGGDALKQGVVTGAKGAAEGVSGAFRSQPVKGDAIGSDIGTGIRRGTLSKVGGLGTEIGGTIKKNLANVGAGIGQGIGMSITNGLVAGLAGAAGALTNIKNLAEFDAASRKSSTLTTDIKALELGAMSLSKELGNTTTGAKLLDSAYDVLSSGFSKTSDVLQILKASQIGAVGGFADVNEVANAATSVINAYGLKAKDVDSVIQQMAGTQNAGKLTIADYASNIGKLASTAAQAGVPLEQINGIISVATAKGVRVSSAFDGVRAAMSAVLKPSGDATKAAKELGIGFDAGALKSKGLVGILQELTAKGKATPETLLKLFGSVEAVAAIAPIAGDGLKDYAKALDTIKNTDAKDAFNKVSKGIEQQQKALGNRAIDLDVKIKTGFVGEALGAGLGIANSAMDALINTVERLNQAYAQLSPEAQGIVKVIGGIAAIAVTVVAGIIAVGAAVAVMGGAISAGIGLVGAIAVGLGSLVIAAAPLAVPLLAAAAAVYGLSKAFGATDGEAFRNSLIAIGAGLAIVFGPAAIGAIAGGVTALVTGFGAIAIAAATALIPLLPWIAAAAAVALAMYGLYKAFEFVKQSLPAWSANVSQAMGKVTTAVKTGFNDAVSSVSGFAQGMGSAISSGASAVAQGASAMGASIKAGFDSAVSSAAAFAQSIGQELSAAAKWFVDLHVASAEMLGAIANVVIQWASKTTAAIVAWASPFTNAVTSAWNKFLDITTSIITATVNAVTGFASRSLATVARWGVSIATAITDAWNRAATATTSALVAAQNAITGFIARASAAVARWVSSVSSAMNNAWSAVTGFVSRASAAFTRWVASVAGSIARFVRESYLIQAATNAVKDVLNGLQQAAIQVFNATVKAAQDFGSMITGAFNGVIKTIESVIGWFQKLPNTIRGATDSINNFNNTRPAAPLAAQTRSANPTPPPSVINEQVAFSGLSDGIVSDSPQSLFARTPQRNRRPPAIPASAQGAVGQPPQQSAVNQPQQAPPPSPPTMVEVMSSVYYPGGNQTAYEGGEIDARNRRLTNQDKAIAIPGLNRPDGIPYGSRVRVTNPANGLSTEADVRDAGPFKPGRQMDVTGAVAKEIKFSGLGILQVEIVKLAPGADPNKVYQFGEATKFRETKTSTIAPGSSLALSQSPSQPQVPTPTQPQQKPQPQSPITAQRPPRVASPFANKTIEQIANQPLNPVEQFRADRIRKGRVVKNDHRGVDYPAEAGTPVFASYSGTAKFEDWGKTYGLALVTTFRDAMGREAVNVRGHIDPTTALAQTGRKVGESFNVQAGQPIGTVKDLGRDFFRRNPGIRNHLHDEAYLGSRNMPPVDARDFMLAQKQAEQTAVATEPRQPDVNLTATQAEEAKLIRALENAQRDRNIASMGLEDLRRNKPIANQRVTGKGKRRRPTGKSQSELDSAYNTRLAAAEEKLRDADDKLLSAQEAISESKKKIADDAKKAADDARKAEIESVNTAASSVTTSTNLKIEGITRRVAEGDRALAQGKPMPATALTEEQGIQEKNKLLVEQGRQLDLLKPKVNELAAKYKDPESLQALSQIAQSIQQAGAAAAESAAELTRKPIGQIEQEIATKISALQLSSLSVDFGVAKNPTESNRLAGEEAKSSALTKMADELQAMLPQAAELMGTFKDPESKRRLEEIVKIIQQQGIEALNTAKAVQQGKVDSIKSEASAIQTTGERGQQEVKNQYDLGNIKSEIELTDKLNQSRLATATALDLLIPKLLALRAAQTDPGIIESINEQIAGIGKYRAEITAAVRNQDDLQRQSNVAFQTTKAATEALGQGLGEVFRSALKGALDLGSALDNILNKVADIGIDALINTGLKSIGIPGFKAGGEVPGFKFGGEVQNFATGGQVLGAIQAVDRALTKEGPSAVLAALTPGEQVLEKNHDAPLYRQMVNDGTWTKMKSSYNYSGGGTVAGRASANTHSRSAASGASGGSKPSVTVTEINSVQYVSLDQLQQIMEVQMPLAARAGAALVERNLTQSSWRQQHGI
jgi:TP901 family phage tail tape measure protein